MCNMRIALKALIPTGLLGFLFFGALVFPLILHGETEVWRVVDEGLSVAEFEAPRKSLVGDSKITVVKINPNFYELKLLSASEHGRQKLTVREWAQKHGLVAAINAGMYQENGITSVGYMKNFNHVNNSRVGRDKTVLGFNPVDSTVPEIQIIDRECQDFESLRRKYQTMVQSIRMISCDQKNVWSQQDSRWSIASIGMDMSGNVLLLFSRSPYSVHDFINMLLELPLSIRNAMYLEGGAQASLYLSTESTRVERYGLWDTGFAEGSSIQFAAPIPNVIGVVKKSNDSK
jgi:uncharacterized protein YigE (DUF2233 family)